MQAKLWRCKICSQAYIGDERPGICPFCGAHSGFIIPAGKWKPQENMKLSATERKNVEAALQLEKSNTSFYLCVSKVSKDPFIQGMFRALARVESEHVGIFTRVLRSSGKACPEQPCTSADKQSVQESLEREIRAVANYGRFLGETREPMLREIFKALVDIEGDHIQLDRAILGMKAKGT
jgi:rubrerythrin